MPVKVFDTASAPYANLVLRNREDCPGQVELVEVNPSTGKRIGCGTILTITDEGIILETGYNGSLPTKGFNRVIQTKERGS